VDLTPKPQVSYADAIQIAREGSPILLGAVGRLFGLGTVERQALSQGRIPWWTWLVAGTAVGVVVGIRVDKKYAAKLPEWIRGK
jgi:hypothetical protein